MRRRYFLILLLALCAPLIAGASELPTRPATAVASLEPTAPGTAGDGPAVGRTPGREPTGRPSVRPPVPPFGTPGSGSSSSAPTARPDASIPSAAPSPAPPTSVARGVPILYYHRVVSVPSDFGTWDPARQELFLRYLVLPAAFEAQLDWLVDNGYTTILPRDLLDHWDNGTALPPKPVILTFDDGYSSWARTVFPLMRERGMVGQFYVTGHEVTQGPVSWRFLREAAAAGFGIGGHQLNHVQLAGLGDRPDRPADEQWAEITGIRTLIHDHLGIWPDSMAYVGGGYSDALVTLVQRAGYTSARALDRGFATRSRQRWALPVVDVRWSFDVVDVVTEELVPGLPKFVARLAGS